MFINSRIKVNYTYNQIGRHLKAVKINEPKLLNQHRTISQSQCWVGKKVTVEHIKMTPFIVRKNANVQILKNMR
jgi:hypothetical protein